MKRYILLVALLTAGCASVPGDSAASKQRIEALEKDVSALKEKNNQLQEGYATQQREYAKQVYTMHVVPLLKPMLKDFGMDEALLVPIDKIENLADAYPPSFSWFKRLLRLPTLPNHRRNENRAQSLQPTVLLGLG